MSEPARMDELVEEAAATRKRAYAPYSGFLVGAAVLAADGRSFAAPNMENASYPLSVCAERGAVHRAVAEGARELVAVAVVAGGDRLAWPCGGCRQVLNEFGPDLLVVSQTPDGRREQRRLSELLPNAFGPDDLA